MAAARVLALALDRPVLGVTSLAALAWGDAGGQPVLAAIDARRGEIYAQAFDSGCDPVVEPRALTPVMVTEVAPFPRGTVVGTGAALALQYLPGWVLSSAPADPDAGVIARRFSRAVAVEAGREPPGPLYLRVPDARLPAGTGSGRS